MAARAGRALSPRGGGRGGARWLGTALAVLLAAGGPEAAEAPTEALAAASASQVPAPATAPLPSRPNAELARDILDLAFGLEDGRALPTLGRFEGSVRVRVNGAAPPGLTRDLDALLGRLRSEAGLDVDLAAPGEAAGIVVEAVPRAEIARAAAGAACFAVPGALSWDGFLALRGTAALDWAQVGTRSRATAFVPADAAPQELRDCLHEEVGQIVGPLGDLSRLADSAFNDDNVHGALTPFDALAIRAINDPALASGMTRAEVAARLPEVLARINPRGERGGARQEGLAEGMALLARGREAGSPAEALAAFQGAERAFARSPLLALHRAKALAQLAGFALARGDAAEVLRLTAAAAPAAEAEDDAALLATLLTLRAEATEALGDGERARGLRLDGLAWGRYGFGDGAEARLAAVRSLSPWRPADATPSLEPPR